MSLSIESQGAEFTEELIEKGVKVNVCHVVKKTPFLVILAVDPDSEVDFSNGKVTAELVYDRPEGGVASLVGAEAFSYTARPGDDKHSYRVQCRVMMLTTQTGNHVRFAVEFKLEKAGHAPLVVHSNPINVVSKQQQIRNQKRRVELANGEDDGHRAKRARTEDIYGALLKIAEAQDGQRLLFEEFLSARSAPAKRGANTEMPLEQALLAVAHAYQREVQRRGGSADAVTKRLQQALGAIDEHARDDLRTLGFQILGTFHGA